MRYYGDPYTLPEEEAVDPAMRQIQTSRLADRPPEPDIRGPEQDRVPVEEPPPAPVMPMAQEEPQAPPINRISAYGDVPQQRLGYARTPQPDGSQRLELGGYTLDPKEEKQVNDLDNNISAAKQDPSTDAVQKQIVLKHLQEQRDALDPGHNYGAKSPRGQMNLVQKAMAQRQYTDPKTGDQFLLQPDGKITHVENKHADRLATAAMKAKDHAHALELHMLEQKAKAQERTDKLESDTEIKRQAAEDKRRETRAKQFNDFVEHHQKEHKKLSPDPTNTEPIYPDLEESHQHAKERMEGLAKNGLIDLGSDWVPSKKGLAEVSKGIGDPVIKTAVEKAAKVQDGQAVKDLRRRAELKAKARISPPTPAEQQEYADLWTKVYKYYHKGE